MSFKHTKFDDSAVMRSLTKVAYDKGMINKDDFVSEVVEKKLDLKVSESLTDNIIKLCAGLRDRGMGKYAVQLENKYMMYKQAETSLYGTKDTAKELMNHAHPKGNVVLDVEGDGVVEDLYGAREAIMKTLYKTPTGKYASSKEIIGGVKKALGQSVEYMDPDKLISFYEKAFSLLSGVRLFKMPEDRYSNTDILKAYNKIQSLISQMKTYKKNKLLLRELSKILLGEFHFIKNESSSILGRFGMMGGSKNNEWNVFWSEALSASNQAIIYAMAASAYERGDEASGDYFGSFLPVQNILSVVNNFITSANDAKKDLENSHYESFIKNKEYLDWANMMSKSISADIDKCNSLLQELQSGEKMLQIQGVKTAVKNIGLDLSFNTIDEFSSEFNKLIGKIKGVVANVRKEVEKWKSK